MRNCDSHRGERVEVGGFKEKQLSELGWRDTSISVREGRPGRETDTHQSKQRTFSPLPLYLAGVRKPYVKGMSKRRETESSTGQEESTSRLKLIKQ